MKSEVRPPYRYKAELASVIACVLLVVAVTAVAWLSYGRYETSEREFALRRAENMAVLLQAHTRDLLLSVDDVLRSAIRHYRQDGPGTDLARLARDYRDVADYITLISVADAEGRLVLSTLPIRPDAGSIATRSHFRAHVERDTGLPAIGVPILGQTSGKWSFHLTRRINRPDGKFGGIVSAGLQLAYWEKLLHTGHFGDTSLIALVGHDGIARAVFGPGREDAASLMRADWGGLVSLANPHRRAVAQLSSGPLTGTWIYRDLEDFPLRVLVFVDEKTLAADLAAVRNWYAGTAGMIILLAALFTAGLLVFFARQRANAENTSRLSEEQRQSDERFRAVFDQAAVGMGLREVGHRDRPWLKVNRKFCEFLGYTEEELLGLPSFAVNIPADEELAAEMERKIIDREVDTYSREKQYLRKDGQKVWGYLTVTVLHYPDGSPARTLSVVQDISDRKKAEAEIAASEERYRALFENNPLPILIRDDETLAILAVNQAMIDKYGYSREEFLAMSVVQLQSTRARETFRRGTARGQGFAVLRRKHITRDGVEMDVDVTSRFIEYRGRAARLVVINDITAQVRSEERLRAIAEHVDEGLALYDKDDRLVFFNENYQRMQAIQGLDLGWSFEEVIRKRAAVLHEMGEIADQEEFSRERLALHKVASNLPIVRRRADGGYHLIRETHTAAGQTIITFSDITDIKRREAELRESEQRFRAIFDNAGVGITLRDARDRYKPWLAVNDKFCEMTGYAREELLRMSTAQVTLPDENVTVDLNNSALYRGEIPSYGREKLIMRKDGSPLWVALAVVALPGPEGRPERVIATYQDITARKLAETRLSESEGMFRAMFNQAGIGMSTRSAKDRHQPWLSVNDKFCEMMGYTREEMLRLCTADLTPPEGVDDSVSYNRRLLAGEFNSYARTKQMVRKDGSLLWIDMSVALLRDAEGRPHRIISTYQDSSARQIAEARLRESEELFRAMFNQAGIGISTRPANDRHAPWTAVNDKFCEMTGYSRDELLRMSTADITAPDGQAAAISDNRRLLGGEISGFVREKQIMRKDGSRLWVALSVAAIRDAEGRLTRLVATYQDIHARKQAEERVREREEYLRAIIAAEPECVATVAPGGALLEMNPAGLRMLGAKSFEEIRRRPIIKYVAAGYKRAFVELHQRILAGESGMLEFEAVGVSGKRIRMEIHAAPLRDAAGRVTTLLGIARDVTERHLAQQALADERNLLRTVIDNLPDLIRVRDRNLQIILANEAWRRAWAPDRISAVGLSYAEQLPLHNPGRFREEDVTVLATGIPSAPRERIEEGEDHFRCFVTTKSPLRDVDGDVVGVVSISRDVTDFKRRSLEVEKLNAVLEQRVAERTVQLSNANQELEAFTASVSHDLRAPLRNLDGLAAGLIEDFGKTLEDDGRRALGRMRDVVRRMSLLIEDMLRLSRVARVELVLRDVDLGALARSVIDDLRREQPGRNVEVQIAPQLHARADAGLLRSAMENLLQNAWKFTRGAEDALIEVGCVQRRGRNAYFVRDNGAGFNMDHVDRLFGAFQRLHSEREFPGTGVGLATVRRIMRRHGGDAWAEAAVGRGAIFFFTLSGGISMNVNGEVSADLAVPAVLPAAIPASAAQQKQAAILLVDDDPDALTLAMLALRPDGYELLAANSGEEAVEVLRIRAVDVIVSDFSMPGMNGAQLLAQAAKLHPATLRIILSGQTQNRAMQAGLRKGEIHHYFEKQHSFAPVRKCIRDWLAPAKRSGKTSS